MKDTDTAKEQLIAELLEVRKRNVELESLKAEHIKAEILRAGTGKDRGYICGPWGHGR